LGAELLAGGKAFATAFAIGFVIGFAAAFAIACAVGTAGPVSLGGRAAIVAGVGAPTGAEVGTALLADAATAAGISDVPLLVTALFDASMAAGRPLMDAVLDAVGWVPVSLLAPAGAQGMFCAALGAGAAGVEAD
jgi:hypothetical protein